MKINKKHKKYQKRDNLDIFIYYNYDKFDIFIYDNL